ncbi:SNF2 family helicase/ATPase [Blastomyces dermatitidis ATCC 18188]|uniref:DNA helicase n=1 Tax=Ajellomyces dermatitidis (strain ATCC 18188 / CBS 674.68) TaxID=653446 RepID=F2T1I3_AJEDA|nr:SNF2 family helicase/ATPase [Blastomyces dermatitidis ATCC 18188]
MEELVPDTPLRNQRADMSSIAAGSDAEHDDQGSSEFEETVATVPLYKHQLPTQTLFTPSTQQFTQKSTQPTQIIDRNPNHLLSPSAQNSSVVQVATSSPLAPKLTPSRPYKITRAGVLSNSMAPIGTQFRPPPMVKVPIKRPPAIDLDDEGPTYRGGSSDEDDIQFVGTTDIKRSTFAKNPKSPDKERILESPAAVNGAATRFKEITASAFYNPSANDNNRNVSGKRSADRMSSAPDYRSGSPKRSRQEDTFTLDDIEDYQTRIKVQRILNVLPGKSIQLILNTLVSKRGNYENALEHLASIEDYLPTDPISDDELSLDRHTPHVEPAKQQIKARTRIQDKWTSSQRLPTQKSGSDRDASAPRKRLIRGQRMRTSSPPSRASPAPARVSKKPGRLIKGRKSRPRSESPEIPIVEIDSSESDNHEDSEDDSILESKVLKFFNSCSVADLSDIAEIRENIANTIISKRPFKSLNAVRQITQEDDSIGKTSKDKSKKYAKKPIGDKVVDKCLDMWTGYEAVDALVSKCEALGKPVANEMKRWGVDIFGTKTQGELEITSLDTKNTSDGTHDSGIGTPSSGCSLSVDDDELKPNNNSRKKQQYIGQPAIMSESITMKNYQIVGINWLNLLFEQNLSCILADDMGLGKTCQVIAFLAHLFEKGVKGPHLVVVPSSTLENWLREFSVFCPKLNVMPYYANQKVRAEIRQQIEDTRDCINVVVTTYTIAKAKIDAAFLRSMDFCVCVYDEGHMLKSSKSVLYDKLIRIPAQFRLLLTGTPLQNNLQELASLLGFILPSVFRERKEDLEYIFSAKAKTVDDTHAALLSAQRIARAKSMLTPFVLRRKKHQVIDLPPKLTSVEYCEMNEAQKEIYTHEVETVRQLIADRAAGKKVGNKSANILMKLRQAAIHPLFYRRHYDDKTLSRIAKACIKDEKWAASDPDQIYLELCAYNDFEVHTLCEQNPTALSRFILKNDEWMHSGKVDKLCELLTRFKENGDRTLVFSQFTMVMDILEHVLQTLQMRFFRLDGSTSVEDRQSTLDAFHEQVDIPVFLLSTKAGGAGINLACANKVIIFDSSFNPQEDVQAENRAHRVGQTRAVEVVRLVTRDTIEEQMYALGQTKLALDQRVSGEDDGGAASARKSEEAGLKVVEEMVIAKLKEEKNDEAGEPPAAAAGGSEKVETAEIS